MKTFLLIFSSVVLFCFSLNSYHMSESDAESSMQFNSNFPLVTLDIGNNSSDKIDEGWYQNAVNNIIKQEYHITYSDELNAHQSPNRDQNMRFIYHRNGFTAKPRTLRIPLYDLTNKELRESEKKYELVDDWKVGLTLSEISRFENSNFSDCSNWTEFDKDLSVNENKAYSENEYIRINYMNDENGMRQDFILKCKPSNEGNVSVEVKAETTLKMTVDEQSVSFSDKNGAEKLNYSSLNVWDANGKKLNSHFTQTGNSEIFAIVVDDKDAVYPVTIDPLSFSPHWTAEGNQAGARLGVSVANAGKVNGDSYGDVILGAPLYDNGQVDEGCVFVYYGSPTGLSSVPGWQKELDNAGAQFGCSVSGAGDYNGDGYDDIIAGAKNYSNGHTNEGAILVSYGSATGLSNIGFIREGNFPDALMGGCVGSAGRVNGDPYYDIIAGAEGCTNGHTNEGRIYVYYGSNIHGGGASWVAEVNKTDANFGYSCSSAGDVNGDGYSDIIGGAPGYENGENSEGAVFVWYGSSTGLGAPGTEINRDWFAESNQPFVQGGDMGASVATLGSVNGDSYSDIIIGSRYYKNPLRREGAVFVYYGGAGGLGAPGTPANADWSALGGQDSAYFGISVSGGDFNNDGYKDILVGAYQYQNTLNNEGAAFVWYGSASGPGPAGNPANADWKVFGNQAGALFGVSVSTAGDVNNDTYDDILVGASQYDNGQANEGRVFFYHGSATGLAPIPFWNVEAQQDGTDLGSVVTTAGYVNGDNYADVIVGAPFYDNGNTDEGLVFVYYGSAAGLSNIYSWAAQGDLDSAQFGFDAGTAGDVNGDGYSDIIIGAKKYANGQNNEGKIFIWYGSAAGLGPDGTPSNADWSFESNSAGAFLGQSVASAGDVNGDGFSDIIAGANNFTNGQSNEGRVYVFHGSPGGLSASPDWTAESNQESALFGAACGTAGDVNGDGFSDVIVGANLYDNGNTNEGAAFLWLGGPGGLGVNGTPLNADWTAETNQDNARMGTAARTAGDVNGDGYSDVIIGARLYDNTFIDEGGAFVWHGSASGLGANGTPANANWSAYGGQNGCSFGYSCASSGDNTLDGYSDIIVGAYGYSGMITNEGAAFIWTGSPLGLIAGGSAATAVWAVYGGQSGCEFGYAVSCAGDVNGDGGSDVVIGAHLYDNGETDEGKAVLYFGSGQTPATKELHIDFFIQGLYKVITNISLVDTATVYIRNFNPPYNKLDSSKAKTFSSGINYFTFSSPALVNNTSYYVHVSHRNSIETWTKEAKFFSNFMSYNLVTSNTKAFGNNEVFIDNDPVRYGIYSGDINQDGSIDLTDIIMTFNDANVFLSGYVNSDLTGDNFVDLSDITVAFNNANLFVVAVTP